MARPFSLRRALPACRLVLSPGRSLRLAGLCVVGSLVASAGSVAAQVVTFDTHTGVVTNGSSAPIATVDRRYQQIEPTHVPLPNSELDAKTRLELIRVLQAEQGFAMRPFPRGHKGLTLAANGKLNPYGEDYLTMVTSEGLSAKPGDRVVVTDVKFDHARIVFDLNGGPDKKHRFLNHVEIGLGSSTRPLARDDGKEPGGARLTLVFQGHVPELTGAEIKALLAPLVSFDVKTPIQAFTDTLPTKLKEAILNHHVLVGMSTEMVLFTRGQPERKTREMEGQNLFEEWIYGRPPAEVDFVRFNGNRVIRIEVAKMGETPVIFTKNEVDGLMRTDGSPLEEAASRTVQMGDVERNPDTQAPAAPPTLRRPGEKLPTDDENTGVMKPVRFSKPKPVPQSGAAPEAQPPADAPSPSADDPQSLPAQRPGSQP